MADDIEPILGYDAEDENYSPGEDANFEERFLDSLGVNEDLLNLEHSSETQRSRLFYTAYKVKTIYLTRNGLELGKAAGLPGARNSIMRVHAPCTKKIVYWKAERFGSVDEKPVLPDPDTGNLNEVCQSMLVLPHEPVLQPGGTVIWWAVEGVYTYLMYDPIAEGDPYQVPAPPTLSLTVADLNAQGFTFSKDVLKCNPPASVGEASLSAAQLNISEAP